MNRRTVLRSALAIPAAAALPEILPGVLYGQEPVQLPSAVKPALSETPKTPTVNADSFASASVRTFQPEQFSALQKLGEIIVPSSAGVPGANEAKAAEFLDFLIGQSAAARRDLYRDGLDALNASARKLYKRPFTEITSAEAAPILAPLREPWSATKPAGTLPQFLQDAKDDFLRATQNSREYITVVAQRRRSSGGSGQYWYPVD